MKITVKENSTVGGYRRYLRRFRNIKIRSCIGFVLLALSLIVAWGLHGKGRLEIVVFISAIAWVGAVFLTDKYTHKYPQRYITYLAASHVKAAAVMAFFLLVMDKITSLDQASRHVLWSGYAIFVGLAAVFPMRRQRAPEENDLEMGSPGSQDSGPRINGESATGRQGPAPSNTDKGNARREILGLVDKPFTEFIRETLPELASGSGNIRILDDISRSPDGPEGSPAFLLIGRNRLNDVRRLNRYLMFCTTQIEMGGFIALRYRPLENVFNQFRMHYSGFRFLAVYLLNFFWYRAIPKIPWLDKFYFSPLFSWVDKIHLSVMKKRNRALPSLDSHVSLFS